jgi:5'-nucleotidase
MHGDFLPETESQKKEFIGGLALLSGYINKVRAEEENVFYVIAGDMVQGSLIDSEFKGISTIEIMNYLSPDVVTLGNHEFDYGLPHLLFLEKMANFPIVNANLYIKQYYRRLMKPYLIINKAGFDFLFTGIVTEKVMDSIKQDSLIGSFVDLEEASEEVGKITNAYKNDDIDLTVLLTHIGFDSDIELAKKLRPEWGVDLIIGGHSHTVLDKPKVENGVIVVTAGTGTNQIGRLDIWVDDDTNSIAKYEWKLVEINSETCSSDEKLTSFIANFKTQVDKKYNSVLCKFNKELTHPMREKETSLGDYIADALADMSETDVMLVGSGSIRVKTLGPVVTLGDLMACFPYDDTLQRFEVTGKQLKAIFNHIMRNSNRNSEGESYQVNSKVKAVHNDKTDKLASLDFNNKKIEDEDILKLCLQGFHINNCVEYLGISLDELKASNQNKIVTTSAFELLKEYFRNHQNPSIPEVGNRLINKLL